MLKDIAKMIADELKAIPMEIIASAIYGSWAKGLQTDDSDIDILIIANNINPKRHRRGKEIAQIKQYLSINLPMDILLLTPKECISNFKNHNPLFLDIAVEGIILIDKDGFLGNLINETRDYILKKGLEKSDDGWVFPVLYRQPTTLSKVTNKDFALAMLTDGERDFDIGIKLTKEGYYDKAIYHFQQATEKSIKAVLILFGEFKKTHYIGKVLISKLENIELEYRWKERLYNIALISNEIEPEVTWSRYPGIDNDSLWLPYEEYTIDDANEIKNKSEEVLTTVKDFIKWWFKV